MAPKLGPRELAAFRAKKGLAVTEGPALPISPGVGSSSGTHADPNPLRQRKRSRVEVGPQPASESMPSLSPSALLGAMEVKDFIDTAGRSSLWSKDFPFPEFIDQQFVQPEDQSMMEKAGVPGLCRHLEIQALRQAAICRFLERRYGGSIRELETERMVARDFKAEKEEAEAKLAEERRGWLEAKKLYEEKIDSLVARVKLDAEAALLRIREVQAEKRLLEEKGKRSSEENDQLKVELDSLKDEVVEQYTAGFDRALEQVRFLHGDLDLVQCGPFKEVIDGVLVDHLAAVGDARVGGTAGEGDEEVQVVEPAEIVSPAQAGAPADL